MSDSDPKFTATEVQEVMDRLEEREFTHTDNVPESVNGFVRKVVENGTLTPDCPVTAELSLTLRERITGTREQHVTAMLIMGMMIGSALERDVPKDSREEEEWRKGNFEIPGSEQDES